MPVDDKLKKCFDEGKRGDERHQGIRMIKQAADVVPGHLAKAVHNFEAMTVFHDLQYSDWSASASFYALYHGLLAILAQRGYESRNQSCTFALVEDLITKDDVKHLTLAASKTSLTRMLLSILRTATKSSIFGNACSIRRERRLRKRNSKS